MNMVQTISSEEDETTQTNFSSQKEITKDTYDQSNEYWNIREKIKNFTFHAFLKMIWIILKIKMIKNAY